MENPEDMIVVNETTESAPEDGGGKRRGRRRPLWVRALKWAGVTAAVVVALVIVICTLAVWILTPQRLTPLVGKVASDYLDADVAAARVELKFWKTFPKMTLEIDSLTMVSRSLNGLPDSVRREMPSDADSLLRLGAFSGALNVAKLLTGELSLYNVEFRSVMVNLVRVNDSVANYLILPPGEEADSTSSASGMMFRKISLNRFVISDAAPLRYRSLPDSLDCTLNLKNVSFEGDMRPLYTFSISGSMNTRALADFNFDSLTFGADGSLRWDSRSPYRMEVDGFRIGLDDFELRVSADADFSRGLIFETLHVESNNWPVAGVCTHLPPAFRHYAAPLKTDMCVQMDAALTSPWNPADSVAPSFDAVLRIPQCSVVYETLHFNRFAAELTANYHGKEPDRSVFTLKRLFIDGRVIDVDLSARATHVFSDPKVEGRFSGAVALGALPPRLQELVPAQLSGNVEGTADFRFRLSDLTPGNFHKAFAKGKLTMKNIGAVAEGSGRAWINRADVEFGSNTAFLSDSQQRIDSLLTVSLKVDTMAASVLGMDVELRGLRAGGGALNRRASTDTTEINPFGVKLAVERLKFDSPADTMRLRLRDASVSGALRRYKGEARLPQMDMKLGLGALQFGQAFTRFALRDADVDVSLHKRQRRAPGADALSRAARRKAMSDSVGRAATQGEGVLQPLDSADRRLLRQWDFNGRIQARRGRVVTPAFPLRNIVRNVDLRFNQDSIVLHDLAVQAGQSDFLVNGTVSNLRRALLARRNNTLGVNLSLESDTINVNEIVRALFSGGALVQQADSAMVWADDDDGGAAADRMVQMADTASTGPLLVPRNLDATFTMRAAHILYSDLVMHSFGGVLMAYDGAINLRDLSASTDVGSIAVDGLYSAPDARDLQFGLGMKVNRFRLDRLTSIVPAIDSILPAIKEFAGTVDADVAVTTDLSPDMEIEIPSLRAAVKIEGDSLVLLDADTFKMLSKWLFFKNKKRNLIDHMSVEVVVENSAVEIYPFMFDIDRYRLGVMGSNDLAMNLDYHVSVLKSPVPFKFGINIKGTPDDMKIRLGGAKFKENMVVERREIADNTRVNIVRQIDNVFRRGISKARLGRLTFDVPDVNLTGGAADVTDDTMSHADSLRFINAGLIEAPDSLRHLLNDSVAEGGASAPVPRH